MSEPTWRTDKDWSNYKWAVVKWKLLHTINDKPIDVEEEWEAEMGTPENLRKAIHEVINDSATGDVTELIQQLLDDVDKLEKE